MGGEGVIQKMSQDDREGVGGLRRPLLQALTIEYSNNNYNLWSALNIIYLVRIDKISTTKNDDLLITWWQICVR